MKTSSLRPQVPHLLFTYTIGTASVIAAAALAGRETLAAWAAVAVAVAASLALTGRIWGTLFLVLTGAAAALALVVREAPWWTLAPAVTAILAGLAVAPAMMRRDRAAGLALVGLTLGLGAGAGAGVAALTPPDDAPFVRSGRETTEAPKSLAYRRAAREARDDLRNGTPRFLTYGYPGPATDLYAELLERRLGVALVPIAGCMVDDDIVDRAAGNNDVVIADLERRYGEGILGGIRDEAERRYAEENGVE